jgi:hypothetical protein
MRPKIFFAAISANQVGDGYGDDDGQQSFGMYLSFDTLD